MSRRQVTFVKFLSDRWREMGGHPSADDREALNLMFGPGLIGSLPQGNYQDVVVIPRDLVEFMMEYALVNKMNMDAYQAGVEFAQKEKEELVEEYAKKREDLTTNLHEARRELALFDHQKVERETLLENQVNIISSIQEELEKSEAKAAMLQACNDELQEKLTSLQERSLDEERRKMKIEHNCYTTRDSRDAEVLGRLETMLQSIQKTCVGLKKRRGTRSVTSRRCYKCRCKGHMAAFCDVKMESDRTVISLGVGRSSNAVPG